MNPNTGPRLRRIGLMIELASIFWTIMLRRNAIPPETIGGIEQAHLALAVLFFGFVVWMTGSAMMYWPWRKAAPPSERN